MRFLRAHEVAATTGLSLATLDRLERRGQFPRRIALSSRAVGWREAEIRDWVTTRVERGCNQFGARSTRLVRRGGLLRNE